MRLFTLTNRQGKSHKKSEQGKVNSVPLVQSSYLQLWDIGIWLKLHYQIALKPIHNPGFVGLQLDVDLMPIQCASKCD